MGCLPEYLHTFDHGQKENVIWLKKISNYYNVYWIKNIII